MSALEASCRDVSSELKAALDLMSVSANKEATGSAFIRLL